MSLRLKLALTLVIVAIPLVLAAEYLRQSAERRNLVENLRQYVTARFEDGGGIRACEDEPETFGGIGSLSTPFARGAARSPQRRRISLTAASLWAYDIGFVSDNEAAPAFPKDLERKLKASGTWAAIWRKPSRVMSERDYWSGFIQAETRRWAHRRPRSRRTPRPRIKKQPGIEDHSKPRPYLEFATFTSGDDGPCAVVLVTGWLREPPGGSNWWWLSYGLTAALLAVVLLAAGPIVRRIRRLTQDVRNTAQQGYAIPIPVDGKDEIAKLALAFNEAGSEIRQRIEAVAQRETALREFVANTTHDVMIPLTVLQGHLTKLRAKTTDNAQAQHSINAAADEAQYLGSILQNLSAVAKLENADYTIRHDPVRLDEIVERVVQRHLPIARGKNVSINHAVPGEAVIVHGDVTLLEQAISNVVHNAVRYNEAGGHVAVLLDVEEQNAANQSSAKAMLRVFDDGPGIPSEELAKLSERRFRGAAARTRNPDGLGLGLHIARDVMSKHGFEIAFKDSEFGGLEVVFSCSLEARPKIRYGCDAT